MRPCIFCQIIAGTIESSQVYRDDSLIAFMDIFPCRPGHVLICPTTHSQYIGELAPANASELFAAAIRIAAAIRSESCSIPCDDVHFVVNDGPAANQTVPHLHMHVIPRRQRDLGLLIGQLAKRPLHPFLRAAPRNRLSTQAQDIRRAMALIPTDD